MDWLGEGLTRRNALRLMAASPVALALSEAIAQSDDYPNREVRVACAFPPGAGADVWVRFFMEQARPLIGKPVLVENKPGGNGLIATEYVARAKPDGYTMLMQSPTSLAANMSMFKNPTIDAGKALICVGTVLRFSFYMLVGIDRPWKSVADVVAHAREKGDKTTFGTTSAPGRLMGNLFKSIMGLKSVEVQYRTSGEGVNDMQSGAVDYMFADGVFAHAQAKLGRVKILAIGSKERMKGDPDIPTMAEQGVAGLDVPGFFGTLVPVGTPRPVIDKINSWLVDIVKTKPTLDFIRQSGGDPLSTTPEQAQAMFLQSIDDWGRLVKLANIQPEG
ncbi:MAG TPA: tripartite tricarboxylate transporter substrate binding protein [Xanthobacteraceae bacterium]|nr:tripartite tricarboxylate transporter substrate binding protein [Xanthobacteraceae bacterium]